MFSIVPPDLIIVNPSKESATVGSTFKVEVNFSDGTHNIAQHFNVTFVDNYLPTILWRDLKGPTSEC
jgi:hypothetical protein